MSSSEKMKHRANRFNHGKTVIHRLRVPGYTGLNMKVRNFALMLSLHPNPEKIKATCLITNKSQLDI